MHPINLVAFLTLPFSDHHRLASVQRSATVQEMEQAVSPDTRPFEQRITAPRAARRMNHAFRYLYRHNYTGSENALEFLEKDFTHEQVLEMNKSFPILLELSTKRQLHPKIQFLKHTLNVTNPSDIAHLIPAQYFGSRLERVLAPHHAFLVWNGLPSGRDLFAIPSTSGSNTQTLFEEFMQRGRKSKSFAALCQSWKGRFPSNATTTPITAQHVDAFDTIFSRGLMAAARNELAQYNNTWATDLLPSLRASEVIRLLLQHGAHISERDHRGASLLHWACGTGHWEGAHVLLAHGSNVWDRTTRDGATPLHWAAAGATAREFGVGGHGHVCEHLLEQVKGDRAYVNCKTHDGNSALMWASWSGTLETVKLMARHRADTRTANRNGCTVAHWAASGGNLEVCRYLADTMGVDFSIPNIGGNTPLTHAVAFGRRDIVQWLLCRLPKENDKKDDLLALSLAQDFVSWTNGSQERKKVLELFDNEDWNF